jgi:hypothetical protein
LVEIRREAREASKRVRVALDALIEVAPTKAIHEAGSLSKFASETLLKLIEQQPSHFPEDPRVKNPPDAAERWFCSLTDFMAQKLCRLVATGHIVPIDCAWHAATILTQALHDLALAAPEHLRSTARTVSSMPSLRTKAKSYDYDFQEIAEAIELSQGCGVAIGEKATYRLSAYATRFVFVFIECATVLQKAFKMEEMMLCELKSRFCTALHVEQIPNLTLEWWLSCRYSKDVVAKLMHFKDLPPFEMRSIDTWWKNALKPHLENPETLEQIRGTKFYEVLEKAAHNSKETTKDYAIVDELKKRCRPALKSISVPEAVQYTFPGDAGAYQSAVVDAAHYCHPLSLKAISDSA